MQFVSEGSSKSSSYSNTSAREEASNPEAPRFAEEGKSLYERLKDNKEKQFQFDTERVTAGGPSAISEEEYMFFIELQRKQKQIAKQVDKETEAFQKQVQSLSYQPDTLLSVVVPVKSKQKSSGDKKPLLNVTPKTAADKRKDREGDVLPAAKRSKLESSADTASTTNTSATTNTTTAVPNTSSSVAPSVDVEAAESEAGSGLSALLDYGSDSE